MISLNPSACRCQMITKLYVNCHGHAPSTGLPHTNKANYSWIEDWGEGGGFTWSHSYSHLGPLDLSWSHLDSLELTWTYLDSLGLTWMHLDSLGLTWTHLGYH